MSSNAQVKIPKDLIAFFARNAIFKNSLYKCNMQKDDIIRVRHMLDAAMDVLSFANGKNRKDLTNDRMLSLSLIKSIEIIGEAATSVSHGGILLL